MLVASVILVASFCLHAIALPTPSIQERDGGDINFQIGADIPLSDLTNAIPAVGGSLVKDVDKVPVRVPRMIEMPVSGDISLVVKQWQRILFTAQAQLPLLEKGSEAYAQFFQKTGAASRTGLEILQESGYRYPVQPFGSPPNPNRWSDDLKSVINNIHYLEPDQVASVNAKFADLETTLSNQAKTLGLNTKMYSHSTKRRSLDGRSNERGQTATTNGWASKWGVDLAQTVFYMQSGYFTEADKSTIEELSTSFTQLAREGAEQENITIPAKNPNSTWDEDFRLVLPYANRIAPWYARDLNDAAQRMLDAAEDIYNRRSQAQSQSAQFGDLTA